ncbi:Protein of unknown function DUF761 [Macleaya cordata]|uniref:Uncharacterized protein n=1 Tax=Macleaya cordata TaxID=56857 RepID=A0A200Q2J9_MACCD|nr:Protein of unknown function DUF761 [Macleaya cordata]
MADTTDSQSQRLVPEINSAITQNQANPSKSYLNFIYKAIVVSIILIILPLFPSQAPEFVNQTIPDRSWELVHLLFVGIAVSYGLFSRRNVEIEKENQYKIENTQTYMSRILQVSSVFDDEIENLSGSDENLVQTWNSKYYRGESTVLVAEENSVFDEQIDPNCNVSIKPLDLPIRSLRSQISDPVFVESVREPIESSDLLRRSYSGSSDSNVNGENGDSTDLDEEFKGNFVLPSPIPWQSRSGRMVMKEQVNSLPPSVEEFDFNELNSQSLSSPDYLSYHPISTSHSPKIPSISPSISPEFRSENVQETEKKNNSKSSSPPAQSFPVSHSHTSSLLTSNSSPIRERVSVDKDIRRRYKDQKDFSRRSREDLGMNFSSSDAKCSDKSSLITFNSSPTRDWFSVDKDIKRSFKDHQDSSRSSREDLGMNFSKPEAKCSDESSLMTFNSSPTRDGFSVTKDNKRSFKDQKDLRRRSREDVGVNFSKAEVKCRTRIEGSSKGKSVRTVRASELVAEARKAREVGGDQLDEKTGKRSKEVEAVIIEKTRKRAEGFNSLSFGNGKSSYESSQHASTSSKYQKKYKKKLVEKVILESEEYSGSEVDDIQESLDTEETALDDISSVKSDSNEVDKKADEFIAKFREQIRLQRVESSKRSNGKHSIRNLSR